MPMVTHISRSPSETEALGVSWGRRAQPGWIIGLSGELGVGKTQLVKGLARGLEIKEPILSPTFVLVHEYRSGRLPLFHLDLYRLNSPQEIIAAGLEEYLYRPKGVAIVEWIERWTLASPIKDWRVTIELVDENERIIRYEDTGP